MQHHKAPLLINRERNFHFKMVILKWVVDAWNLYLISCRIFKWRGHPNSPQQRSENDELELHGICTLNQILALQNKDGGPCWTKLIRGMWWKTAKIKYKCKNVFAVGEQKHNGEKLFGRLLGRVHRVLDRGMSCSRYCCIWNCRWVVKSFVVKYQNSKAHSQMR